MGIRKVYRMKRDDVIFAVVVGGIANAFFSMIGQIIRFVIQHPFWTALGFCVYCVGLFTYEALGMDVTHTDEIFEMSLSQLDDRYGIVS